MWNADIERLNRPIEMHKHAFRLVTCKRAADGRKIYIRELRTCELGDINNCTFDKITNKCRFRMSKVIDCYSR
jgi:hypothetical protein